MSAHRAESADWLEALNRAVCLEFPNGIREVKNLELNLMSDNGSQPTSLKFMTETAALGIRQAFTSYANPKGNADTERVIRTIKEELTRVAGMGNSGRSRQSDAIICR